jgi:hypothetical protein
MFGSSNYSTVGQGSGHLLVSAPGTSLFGPLWIIGIPIFMLLVAFLVAGSLRRNYVKNVAKYPQLTIKSVEPNIRFCYRLFSVIGVGGAIFFWALGYSSGSIELDRSTNTATINGKMTAFLPAQHRTVPLQSVTNATLDYKPNSRRIRLEVSHGQDLAFPIWSDRDGQDKAVDAINQFLQAGTTR